MPAQRGNGRRDLPRAAYRGGCTGTEMAAHAVAAPFKDLPQSAGRLCLQGRRPRQPAPFLPGASARYRTGGGGRQHALLPSLRNYPLPVPDDPALRDSLAGALAWFASQPEAGRWLEQGWPEQSLMDEQGHVLRMDLLVRESWGPLVIDYKSGRLEAAAISQGAAIRAASNRAATTAARRAACWSIWISGVSNWLKRRGFRLCETCGELLPSPETGRRNLFALSITSPAAAFFPRSESRAGRLQRRPFRFRAADCAA